MDMTDAEEKSTFRINLQLHDVAHPGVQRFFQLLDLHPQAFLEECLASVDGALYSVEVRQGWKARKDETPFEKARVRSVTIALRSMPGVAHATSHIMDSEHKEIHLSADYVQAQFAKLVIPTPSSTAAKSTAAPATATPAPTPVPPPEPAVAVDLHAAAKREIQGVLVHELAHAFQFNGKGTAPGGLVEGIADWVRLQARLDPPHWKKRKRLEGVNWDTGYEVTAYFLQWISEHLHDMHLVSTLNQALRTRTWDDKRLFSSLFGHGIDDLWLIYKEEMGTES